MGLDVPQASKLRHDLAQAGVDLPPSYLLDDLAGHLAAYLKGGAADAT